MTLYLSSPPSGSNPDSDPSPLSLASLGKVIARPGSTWLGILTPIQVNVPFGLVFNCQVTVKGNHVLLGEDRIICPFTFTPQTRGYCLSKIGLNFGKRLLVLRGLNTKAVFEG